MDVQVGPSFSHHSSLSALPPALPAADGRSQASLTAPGNGLHYHPTSTATAVHPSLASNHAHDTRKMRKRKAESQDTYNERLSKRLSLLNLGVSRYPYPVSPRRVRMHRLNLMRIDRAKWPKALRPRRKRTAQTYRFDVARCDPRR